MFVRVRDSTQRKKSHVVRAGEKVRIRSMPGSTPLSRVDPQRTPTVASIDNVRGQKITTVEYRDTEDGQVHLVSLPRSALAGGGGDDEDDALNIGDRVELIQRGGAVCPSIGSRGTVLGGSDPYTVTFSMTTDDSGAKLDAEVTITQDHVPRSALQFVGEAPDDMGDEDPEDKSDESESEDMDDVAELNGGSRPVATDLTVLKTKLTPSALDSVMLMLNLEEMSEMADVLGEVPSKKDRYDAETALRMFTASKCAPHSQ